MIVFRLEMLKKTRWPILLVFVLAQFSSCWGWWAGPSLLGTKERYILMIMISLFALYQNKTHYVTHKTQHYPILHCTKHKEHLIINQHQNIKKDQTLNNGFFCDKYLLSYLLLSNLDTCWTCQYLYMAGGLASIPLLCPQ